MSVTYPEHEKLAAVKVESQAIGEFLSRLFEAGRVIAVYHTHTDDCYVHSEFWGRDLTCGAHDGELVPVPWSTERALAAYFDIDLVRLEDEKRAMLDEIRRGRGRSTMSDLYDTEGPYDPGAIPLSEAVRTAALMLPEQGSLRQLLRTAAAMLADMETELLGVTTSLARAVRERDKALRERDKTLKRVELLRTLSDKAAYESGLAQRRMMEAQAKRDDAHRALSLARSMIACGESMTPQAEAVFEKGFGR